MTVAGSLVHCLRTARLPTGPTLDLLTLVRSLIYTNCQQHFLLYSSQPSTSDSHAVDTASAGACLLSVGMSVDVHSMAALLQEFV